MTDKTREQASRRMVMGVALAGIAATVAAPARAQGKKLAQKAVQYVEVSKRPQKCDTCVQWQPPNGCKIVDGEIAAGGWCLSYAPAPKPAAG